MEEQKKRGKDTTGAKRLGEMRERMVRLPEVYLTPEAYAEVEAMLLANEGKNKADLLRVALHEKFIRWKGAQAVEPGPEKK